MDINNETIANGEVRDGISAYIQALKGKDSFTRGQRDKIKFSNKRRKDDDEDEEMEDIEEKPRKEKSGGDRQRERKNSFPGRGGRGGHGGHGGRVQKPPKSPVQRGGGTASIGRRKF